MSSETIRLITNIRDREEGTPKGVMEVGEEGDYIYSYHYTAATRMIPALRWAALRAILMYQ